MDEEAFRIVYQDKDWLVCAKAPGIPTTMPGGGDSLVKRLRAIEAKTGRLHPISRLDRHASGVVLVARSDRAIQAAIAAHRKGLYARIYLGLSEPPPPQSELVREGRLVCCLGIAIDPRHRRLRRAVESGAQGAKPAQSEIHLLGVNHLAALLLFRPRTGRTHQLRVHVAALGFPLLGDRDYGGKRRVFQADGRVIGVPRLALHCAAVALPFQGEVIGFCSPVAQDLRLLSQAVGLDFPNEERLLEQIREELKALLAQKMSV
ncbi:MAG: pseudouridine synthase [Sandaracinaceae bacterium]|nr:pseudouridine synthase [Sandaracinaceae bacterium]